jgi:hypothetical protein
VCQAMFCSKHGHPLTICSCEDGEHHMVLDDRKKTESSADL